MKLNLPILLFSLAVQGQQSGSAEAEEEMSLTSWIFIGAGIFFVPAGIITLALWLERRFGRAEKAKKT